MADAIEVTLLKRGAHEFKVDGGDSLEVHAMMLCVNTKGGAALADDSGWVLSPLGKDGAAARVPLPDGTSTWVFDARLGLASRTNASRRELDAIMDGLYLNGGDALVPAGPRPKPASGKCTVEPVRLLRSHGIPRLMLVLVHAGGESFLEAWRLGTDALWRVDAKEQPHPPRFAPGRLVDSGLAARVLDTFGDGSTLPVFGRRVEAPVALLAPKG